MAHHFEYDAAQGVLLVILEGHVDRAEILRYHDEVKERLRTFRISCAITDLTLVTSSDLPGSVVWELALKDAFVLPAVPRCIVAPQDHIYGIARMYQLSSNVPHELLQIFRTRKEALSALGLDDPTFKPWTPR
ncbi:MAG: hypothetical protein WCB53_09240 [Terriglobales bacterium]